MAPKLVDTGIGKGLVQIHLQYGTHCKAIQGKHVGVHNNIGVHNTYGAPY